MKQLKPAGTELDDRALANLYATGDDDRLFLRLNMVSTIDGSAHGPDSLTGTINTPADNRVFAMLRAWADVIVAGSRTVNAEGYQGVTIDPRWSFLREGRPANPPLAVLTSASKPPSGVTTDADDQGPVITLTADRAAGMAPALAQLRDRGFRRVLCEGGPTVAGELLSEGLADELCLSLAPHVVVGAGGRIAHGPTVLSDWTLAGILEEDDTLLTRWRPTRA